MNNWDYATHSHIVKTLGGPQKYIAAIRAHERQLTTAAVNKKWIRGAIPTLLILFPLAVKGGYDFVTEYMKRKNISDEEAQQAEKELIEFFEEPNREEYISEESPC